MNFDDIDRRDDNLAPENRGSRVWNAEGTEYGVSLGLYGGLDRITLLWRDGKKTHPVTGGILFRNGRWQIS